MPPAPHAWLRLLVCLAGLGLAAAAVRYFLPIAFAAEDDRPDAVKARARASYLRHLRDDLRERLRNTVGDADSIPLRVRQAPDFVEEPHSHPSNLPAPATVESAFVAFDKRLLILGAPGSGKSMSLDTLLSHLAEEAAVSAFAPLPIRLSLATLPFESLKPGAHNAFSRGVRGRGGFKWVERWVRDNLPNFADRSRVVENWLSQGDLAWFLDGLDEVPEEHLQHDRFRVRAASRKPDTPVVVCAWCSAAIAPSRRLSSSHSVTRVLLKARAARLC